MAKIDYPNTTLQPLQTLDFQLANGKCVRTILKPTPNVTGTHVAHVDLEYTNAGGTSLYPIDNQGQTLTVFQAGVRAYQIAQDEAYQAGNIKIVKILLEGEEFLEQADVEQITGNAIPVTVV